MVPDERSAACVEAGLPLLTFPREPLFLAVSRAYWELVRQGGEAELTALLGLQVALATTARRQATADTAAGNTVARQQQQDTLRHRRSAVRDAVSCGWNVLVSSKFLASQGGYCTTSRIAARRAAPNRCRSSSVCR
jgi:hypothetical protein